VVCVDKLLGVPDGGLIRNSIHDCLRVLRQCG